MADQPNIPQGGIAVETEALKALQFYMNNYSTLVFAGLGSGNKPIVLGTEPFQCRFCGGKPPVKTFTKRAHAVSELLGNKILELLYECDDCNKRFSKFEDDLGKMTLPVRSIGGVIGKSGVPQLLPAKNKTKHKASMELKDGVIHMSHDAGDISLVDDELTKTLTFTYREQKYRPLGAYKALCKSAFTLLPPDELIYFEELKQWLLQEDLTTGQVYANGSHLCHTTFVPAFQPFRQPIVLLLKRNEQIEAGYMSFFIAFGNVSYQIFLPSPSQDNHLLGKTIQMTPYPHFYQLQPWLIPAPTQTKTIDLSSPDRTTKGTGTIKWKYGQKVQVS